MTLQHAMCCLSRIKPTKSTPTSVCSFPREDGRNSDYSYLAGPKKVILIGTKAFDDFLKSIQAKIGSLKNTVTLLNMSIEAFTDKPQLTGKLKSAEARLKETNEKIEALNDVFVMMQKDWSDPKSRVIGHVVWALPITGKTPPHGYTQDVGVMKLDKDRFMPNFIQDVINLGAC